LEKRGPSIAARGGARKAGDGALVLGLAGAMLAILAADLRLPLGIAVWVLYFAPLALTALSRRPALPIIIAAAALAFVVAGYLWSPPGGPEARYAPLNRGFALATLVVVAVIARRFIVIRTRVERDQRFRHAQAALTAAMVGQQTFEQLGGTIMSALVRHYEALVGAVYFLEEGGTYRRFGTHALDPETSGPATVGRGEGLIGQVARDGELVHVFEVPSGYLDVRSAVGKHPPRELIVAAASTEGSVQAVIELGFLGPVDEADLEFLALVSDPIASAVRAVRYRLRQRELLEETQRQSEELQAQQEELRVQNEELEQQSHALQESQTRLENQQAELQQINSQLEEHTQSLAHQRDALARGKRELQAANAYKSEFLANMSHELRTPLNSSLILAKLLTDNREGNLTPEQIKYAQTIYTAGNDLLTLINDILDHSKIEAGKLDVRPETVSLGGVMESLASTFQPLADERKLRLTAEVQPGAPPSLVTDSTRLQQILKNLLSNAIKFTEHGSVAVRAGRAADGRLAFTVEDTGVGIPADKQQLIFDAFRQVDGASNRKHGGTGLGLSISRELARLLGGELTVASEPGRGSTFTLLLPEEYAGPPPAAQEAPPALPRRRRARAPQPQLDAAPDAQLAAEDTSPPAAPDDRANLTPGARTILIVEDDLSFAGILRDLAHELEFQALIAQTADESLAMVERYHPSAIVLDIGLPDRSGLTVLDALKHNPTTRHIPVHVVSASDYAQTAMQMGAAGYAIKPVAREDLVDALRRLEAKFTQKLRRILVVEDDDVLRDSTGRLLGGADVELVAVGTAAEALERLAAATFDCMVLDLSLPDRSGLSLLEEMSQKEQYGFPPVIVYTGRSLSAEEERELRRFSSSIIIKGARSPERLLDEVTLFLHQVETDLPPDRQRMLRDARHREAVFEDRRVLVVEDDVRNVFALTSVLEPRGAKVEIARNGREALAHLRDKPGVDLVLMDIMMPEMDGLQAMREIRKQDQHSKLPIIALTAKAMADDRDDCLAAGASDYIAKPLDVDKLLSLARVWMPR
jgi:signal transduction histidine kinase/DNA-binding response OmpR family regulator